jgi:hypothetical protein
MPDAGRNERPAYCFRLVFFRDVFSSVVFSAQEQRGVVNGLC